MNSANGHLTSGDVLARNVGWNLGGSLLPAIAALVAVPLLIRGLGDARFGILALAWTTLGYFSLFDMGIGRAVTHAIADRLGRNHDDEIGAVMWTSAAALIPVGFIGAVALFVIAPWLSHDLLRVPAQLLDETTLSFRILAVAIPFAGVTAAVRGALEAKQLFGTINALRVPHGLVVFLGPVAVLPFSNSLVPAVLILAAGRIAFCIAHIVIAARALPQLSMAGAKFSAVLMRRLLGFGGWMTVSNIISPIMATLDRFVVGAVLSVSVVTYYAAPHELVTKMWLFTAALLPVFFPAFATSAAHDRERTAMLFSRLLRLTFSVLLLPTALLVLLAPDILRIWLGASFATQSTTVLQVLAIAVFVNTLGQAALTLIQSLGRPDITGKYHLAELPFYAALLWFLLPRYGLVGAAIAWSVRAVADAVILLLTCPRLLAECRAIVLRAVVWIAASMPALVACMFLQSFTTRAAVAIMVIPFWLTVCWSSLLTPEERSAPLRAVSAAWRTT